jgi:hypothetical protein
MQYVSRRLPKIGDRVTCTALEGGWGTVVRVLDTSGKASFDPASLSPIRVEVVKDADRLRRKFVFDWAICLMHGEKDMLSGVEAKDPTV